MYAARPHEQDQQRATLNIACSNSPYSVPRETSIQVSSPGNANEGRIGQYLSLVRRRSDRGYLSKRPRIRRSASLSGADFLLSSSCDDGLSAAKAREC